jgi:hypothetical protein
MRLGNRFFNIFVTFCLNISDFGFTPLDMQNEHYSPTTAPATNELLGFFEQLPSTAPPATHELHDFFEQPPSTAPAAHKLLDFFEQLPSTAPRRA